MYVIYDKNEKIFDKYMTWEKVTLCTKCPYSELFRSTFSCIWTEYGKMRARVTPNTDTFHVVGEFVFRTACIQE